MSKDVVISEDGFLNMLQSQNGGAVIDELDREMIDGINSVLDHGGTSEITLKLKFKKVHNMDGVMEITHDVIAKHPKEQRPSKAMFLTPGNGLSDQQQDQDSLDLGAPVERASVSHLTPIESK